MRLRKDSRQKSENNLAGAKSFNAKIDQLQLMCCIVVKST